MRVCVCIQIKGNTGPDRSSENIISETEELNFQFDDYGGKKYNFSEEPSLTTGLVGQNVSFDPNLADNGVSR